jgi:hypothetical protein
MFEFDNDGPRYYIRLEQKTDYLNLLYVPHADFDTAQANQSLMLLFRQYADPCGTIAYFDPHEYCIISSRAKEYKGLRVYLYDDQAPYDGYYLDGRFIEALEEVP